MIVLVHLTHFWRKGPDRFYNIIQINNTDLQIHFSGMFFLLSANGRRFSPPFLLPNLSKQAFLSIQPSNDTLIHPLSTSFEQVGNFLKHGIERKEKFGLAFYPSLKSINMKHQHYYPPSNTQQQSKIVILKLNGLAM